LSTVITAVQRVQAMPNLNSPSAAPNLSNHISESKIFANTWLQGDAHNVSHGIQSVSTMSNNWKIYRAQIQQMGIEPTNKKQLWQILQRSDAQSKAAKQEFDSLRGKLADDTKKVAQLSAELTGDTTQIQAKLQGDQAAIRSLQQQIAAAQAKINDYHSRDWLNYIPIVGIVGGLERAIEYLVDNIEGDQKQISVLNRESSQLQADVQELTVIMRFIENWMQAMKVVTVGIGSLGSGVDAVASDLSNTVESIETLNDTVFPIWVQAKLNSIDDDMKLLNELVNILNG